MKLGKLFKNLEHFYSDLEPNFKLLPFRFIKLDETRYVLTNLVGEFIVVKRQELESIVKRSISHESALYNSLKSKHFIMDNDSNVAIDLLSLKYRTKAHYVAQFTGLHIFVVTLRCDYSCPYCQVSRQTEDKGKYDMSPETANKALEMVFKSPSPNIKIEFQGGETLLNFNLIQHIVLEAKKINQYQNRSLQFVIATNLTFLDEEILSFCLKHNIYISTSLDGPSDLHNKNRPRPGKNGYELTVEGIRKAQAYLGKDNISALMTTTEASMPRIKEIIDTYVNFGFNSIFLRPLSPYGFAVKTKQLKYNTEKWVQFYKDGLDYILDINRKGYFLAESYTSILLSKMSTTNDACYVDLQSPAGIGIGALVYNYDGNVYASDEARMLAEMNDESFKLGNLHKNTYAEIMTSDNLLDPLEKSLAESAPMCHDCGFLPYCGSDPIYHYTTQKDVVGNKALSGFCSKNMEILRHIIKLIEDDPEAKEILMNWVRV